jgi:DNA-binding SARP family transcriptional activator
LAGVRGSVGEHGWYEAQLFGLFRVLRDGVALADTTRRASARTLLKWFLLNPGQKFRDTELSEVLWPGCKSDRANRLHVTQHALRRILEPELPSRRPSTFIHSDTNGRYWFDPSNSWSTDLEEVERLSKSARAAKESGNMTAAIASYERLLGYYSRGFLPEDVYVDAFAPFRTAHDVGHAEALCRLLRLYRETGQLCEALICAMGILERDPYSEEAVTSVVEVHVEQGSVTGAISELERFTRTLEEDLGTEPSRELRALWGRVRHAR